MLRRILTLDGGGIKGTFTAAFLAELEEELDQPIGSYFDLISGTSTGGIIALALGLGLTAQEVLDFYKQLGTAVFGGNRVARVLRQVLRPKYDDAPLRRALDMTFAGRKLGESRVRLVIPSVNLATGEVYVYKTAHDERFRSDFRERAVTVALATAAAPTYFPAHTNAAGVPLVDGGMWANNPAGVAVVEAIGVLGWRAEDLRVLSVGCTQAASDFTGDKKLWSGSLYWATKVADLFLAAQTSASLGTARLLTGDGAGAQKVYRVNRSVPNGRFTLDGVRQIRLLEGLGADAARHTKAELMPVFFACPAEPFVPLTGSPQTPLRQRQTI